MDFKRKYYQMLLKKQTTMSLFFQKQGNMSRLKQNQNIDNFILSIVVIAESQCSHSEEDKIVLNEALERLRNLKRKKGKTNEQIQCEFVIVVELLTKYFVK
jgi:hypothetical protein